MDDLAAEMNRQGSGLVAVLGLEFVTASATEVVAELAVAPHHHQVHGLVHGGVHCAVVETVCSVGAMAAARRRGQTVVGVENHTSFLRPVREGRLRAVARPLAAGRRMQLWEASISDEQGRLVATGRVRLFCIDPEGQELPVPARAPE